MLTMNHLFLYLVVFSFVALSSALKCDDRYSETTGVYFELKENFYNFSGSVYDCTFKFNKKSKKRLFN